MVGGASSGAATQAEVQSRRDVAAVAVAAQQHGMVVLDDRRRGDPAREALERHRVGARRAVAARPARRRGGLGRRRAAACPSPRSRSRSCRGCTAREPESWARAGARVPAARLAHVAAHRRARHRPRRRVGHRILGRRGATGGRSNCSRIVDGERRLGSRAARSVPARTRRCRRRCMRSTRWSSLRAPATTWRPRSRSVPTRPGSRTCSRVDRHVGHRLHVERRADGRRVRSGCRLRRRDRSLPSARVHANATKVTDAIARWLWRRPGDARRHGAGGAGRRRRCGARAVSRR